ncbi:hypothetical protein K439DRAFT_800698 [Ramaria rubella]|nr:hypothetical protein K439DRAFT_800698 [Ramaria rubella]
MDARTRFSERFFGNDMDFGHKLHHEKLQTLRDELEHLLAETEQRGYELLLASQNALWALEPVEKTEEICCEPTHNCELKQTESPNDLSGSVEPSIDEDPLEAFYQAKIATLRMGIKEFLALHMTVKASKYIQERREVLWALVRRVVFQHASLMLLAQRFDSVETFLFSDVLEVAALEKILDTLVGKNCPVFGAIEDVFRLNKNGKRVRILGGYVYQKLHGCYTSLYRVWAHTLALGPCYNCVRGNTCKSVDQVIDWDKWFTLMTVGVNDKTVDFPDPQGNQLAQLKLCGVTPYLMGDIPKAKIEKLNVQGGVVWEEEEDGRNVIALGLSLHDPKAMEFLNKCLSNPDFSVMWRKGPNGPISQPPDGLVSHRFRIATSRARLRYAPWKEQKLETTLLEECYYVLKTDRKRHNDCYQIAITDKIKRPLQDFLQCLVEICYAVYSPKTPTPFGLLQTLARDYIPYYKIDHLDGRLLDAYNALPGDGWELLWGDEPYPVDLGSVSISS